MVSLWWISPAIHIVTSTDAVIYTHNVNALHRDDRVLNIFTDESVIEGYVRAAAVTLRVKEGRVCYIGTEGVTTVFKAELQNVAIVTIMAITIKKTQIQNM